MDGKVSIIHYKLTKSNSVCRSALAAELLALIDGYDARYTIAYSLEKPYGRKVNLSIYTDSHPLYGLCISLEHTTERRLQSDSAMISHAHESMISLILYR